MEKKLNLTQKANYKLNQYQFQKYILPQALRSLQD